MFSIASNDLKLEQLFDPVSLSALNSRAEMLERLDNKYVVDAEVLRSAAEELADQFDVLEIDGRRSFTYDTCYFDNAERRSYLDHHQGRRRRAKVRMRRYVDAGLCFVEVKLKDKRGVTVKKRLPYPDDKFGTLGPDALAFVYRVYHEQYGLTFPYPLARVVDIRYRRMTLVAKRGGERMTIDNGMQFFAPGSSHAVADDRFILETKSARGNGIADGILRALHQHPTKHCSKYCAAIALLHRQTKHNRFLPALRKLGAAPPAEARWAATPQLELSA